MILYISIIFFILGFVIKKSRGLYFLQFAWMWIVIAFCNNFNRVDYQNYILAFKRHGMNPLSFTNTEMGYAITDKIFYQLGFSFEIANLIYSFVVLLIIALIIPKYTDNINIPASLFMVFPLLLNGIQIRNALSSVFIIWGIQFLFNNEKGNSLKYILCVLGAILFHTTALFYLAFLMIKIFDNKKLAIIASGLSLVMLSLVSFFTPLLSNLVGTQRFVSKFISTNSLIECLVAILWILFLLVILIGMRSVSTFKLSKKIEKFSDIIIGINIISIILIPMFYIDFSFERLFRNWIIYAYIMFANFLNSRKNLKYYFYLICFVLWLGYSVFVFEVLLGDRLHFIIEIYLNNNALFDNPIDHLLLLSIIVSVGSILIALDKRRKRLSVSKFYWKKFRIKI